MARLAKPTIAFVMKGLVTMAILPALFFTVVFTIRP